MLEIEKYKIHMAQDLSCCCPVCMPAGVQRRMKSGIPAFFQDAGRELRLRERLSAAQRNSTARLLIKQRICSDLLENFLGGLRLAAAPLVPVALEFFCLRRDLDKIRTAEVFHPEHTEDIVHNGSRVFNIGMIDRSLGLNLVYTWDKYGHGTALSGNCIPTGYLGYAYLETPGNSTDGLDNDNDGIVDELRDNDAGTEIIGRDNIRAYVQSRYNISKFEAFYGSLETRPAYKVGRWWTGDENLTWVQDYDDLGGDGLPGTEDPGEGDGRPTDGEPDFNQTDKDESDQIGLTGFKMNRIRGPSTQDPKDDIVFYGLWPPQLYDMFTDPNPGARFDSAVVLKYIY